MTNGGTQKKRKQPPATDNNPEAAMETPLQTEKVRKAKKLKKSGAGKNTASTGDPAIPRRASSRNKKSESEETPVVMSKTKKRGAEEEREAPVKKKGKAAMPTARRYPPVDLANAEENEAPVRKDGTKTKGGTTPHKKKGAKVTGAREEVDPDVEAGSDSSGGSESDSLDRVDEDSGLDEPSSSEVELRSALDLEPVLEKKVPSARKPSKKAIETALSERPIFIDESEHETDFQNLRHTAAPDVKVKVEAVDTDSDNGDDEDDDQEEDTDRNDEESQAKRVYDRALKVLRFKLYFEDFFPADDDKGALVYDCWMAGAKTTRGLNGDRAALKWMLYHYKYDKQLEKRISAIRNVFITRSANRHEHYYKTNPEMVAALRDDRYVYPGDPKTAADPSLLYRNPLITDILKQTLFAGRDTLPKLFPNDLTVTEDGQIEMPVPLVAAAATLVYGLLRRDTLPPPDGGWKFSTSGHQNTYKKHLNSLGHLKNVNDVGLSVLLVTIYRKSSGVTEPIAAEGDLVKGINAAALPRVYNLVNVEE